MRTIAVVAVICLILGGAVALLMPSPQPLAVETAAATPPRPDHHAVLQELTRAANRLENSPCDRSLREPLHTAINAFALDMQWSRRNPDLDSAEVMIDALHAGVISAGEVPGMDVRPGEASMAYGDGKYRVIIRGHGRFYCDLGGSRER